MPADAWAVLSRLRLDTAERAAWRLAAPEAGPGWAVAEVAFYLDAHCTQRVDMYPLSSGFVDSGSPAPTASATLAAVLPTPATHNLFWQD